MYVWDRRNWVGSNKKRTKAVSGAAAEIAASAFTAPQLSGFPFRSLLFIVHESSHSKSVRWHAVVIVDDVDDAVKRYNVLIVVIYAVSLFSCRHICLGRTSPSSPAGTTVVANVSRLAEYHGRVAAPRRLRL